MNSDEIWTSLFASDRMLRRIAIVVPIGTLTSEF